MCFEKHWIRYLSTWKYLKLCIFVDYLLYNFKPMLIYVDAEYKQDINKKKSIIRNVFTFNYECISKRSTLQVGISHSTMRVEYVATIIEATKKTMWLNKLIITNFDWNARFSIFIMLIKMHYILLKIKWYTAE